MGFEIRRKQQRDGAPRRAPYTVLIVDDEEIIRRGIAAIISAAPDFFVCGSAGDEATAVKLVERHHPDLLLLDLSLGHRDGLQFLKGLAGRVSGTEIIALSEYGAELYGNRAVQAGATAYLTKRCSATQLLSTLRAIATSERLHRSSRARAQHRIGEPSAKVPDRRTVSLTDRELHVFRLIAAGLGTSRIAQELAISRKTVETYREHIKLKLGYANAEALRMGALEWAAQSQHLKIRETPDRQP